MMFTIDLVAAPLKDIVRALNQSELSSENLVFEYLARIAKDNHHGLELRPIIEVAPRSLILERARHLDAERATGKVRGHLHGVPIVIKDTIYTDQNLGMETTAGVNALVGSKVPRNASVVDNLLRAGAIIIGKANLSVLSQMYGGDTPLGWSPRGGQVLNPYTLDPSPRGSSSGSAVALASGFCAASIGGETFGSIINPATRAGLFSLKPSIGLVSTDGVISISSRFDVLGPFGKTAWDVAATLSGMVSPFHDYTTYVSQAAADSSNFKLGVWKRRPAPPTLPPGDEADEIMLHFERAVEKISISFPGAITVNPVDLKPPGDALMSLKDQGFRDGVWYGQKTLLLLMNDLHDAINTNLSAIDGCDLKTIDDLIKWNEQHPDLAFPDGTVPTDLSQCFLRWASESGGRKGQDYTAALEWLMCDGKAVRDYMYSQDIDALLVPGYAENAAHLSGSIGFPIATVPTGILENGNPIAIWLIAKPGEDAALLSMMAACENVFPPRPLPQPLVQRE